MTQYRRYTNSLLRVARHGATLATPGVIIDRSFVYIIGAQALSAQTIGEFVFIGWPTKSMLL